MPDLDSKHHTLIQALLSRGPLEQQEFYSIFSGVTGRNPGTHQQLFNDYLLKINKELAYVQYELRGCRNQYDGKVYYGVVNNVADEHSKLGTKYSVPQIAFYKGVIEAIMHDATAHGSISNIDALNIRLENQAHINLGSQSESGPSHVPPALKNFSISQKERTLEDLVQDQWLCSTPDGNIGIGVRSFLDLRSWFRTNDVPSCEICNEAGVKAELCQNGNCTVRIHSYCSEKKFSQRKVERVCPVCGTKWQRPVSKVEAVEEEENECGQSKPSSEPSSGRKRLRSCKTEKGSSAVSAVSQASVSVSDSRRTTRSSARLR